MGVSKNKICLLLVILMCSAEGANILAMFLMPSYSHQMPLLRLSKALAARGHNLTVITANPSETPIVNHTEIDISFAYDMLRNGSIGLKLQSKQKFSDMVQTGIYVAPKLAELELKSPQIQTFMSWVKDVKFDVVLYESIGLAPFLALAHMLGPPPVIGVTTVDGFAWTEDPMGSPTNLAYIPVVGPYSDHMTFFERLYNLYDYFYFEYYMQIIYSMQDKVVKNIFGEGFPTAYEMESNKTLLLMSSDGILTFPKSRTPNIVQLGPLHIVPPKPLTGDLKTWIEGAKDGVIYFSLGSNMQGTSLSEEKRNEFLAAFRRFPNYRIIWKWETDTFFPGQADNIMFKKWLPQQDLLAHNKVKVFISQCGLQSAQEAIHHGVNLICIPLFGDQDQNSQKVIKLEIGVELDLDYIKADMIYEALKEIIYNKKYRQNVERVSAIAKDTMMSPVDTGVWWVEYVLRHKGAKHLRPATLDLHWTQYCFVDIASFLITVLIIIVLLVIKLTKMALKWQQTQTVKSKKAATKSSYQIKEKSN